MELVKESGSFKLGRMVGNAFALLFFSAVIFVLTNGLKINYSFYLKILLIVVVAYLILVYLKNYRKWL